MDHDKILSIYKKSYSQNLCKQIAMMISKIQYIHQNPVKRRYIDNAVHWKYSSARDYESISGLNMHSRTMGMRNEK